MINFISHNLEAHNLPSNRLTLFDLFEWPSSFVGVQILHQWLFIIRWYIVREMVDLISHLPSPLTRFTSNYHHLNPSHTISSSPRFGVEDEEYIGER